MEVECPVCHHKFRPKFNVTNEPRVWIVASDLLAFLGACENCGVKLKLPFTKEEAVINAFVKK